MSFPASPSNGQLATVNNIAYVYASATNSWTRTTSSNITVGGYLAATSVRTDSYRFANGTSYVGTSIANSSDLTANVASGTNIGLTLTATGVTGGVYGSATAIPTIVVDNKGRVTSITSNAVSTTISLAGTSGTGSVAGGGTLTFAGSNGFTATASGSTITLSTSQNLQTNASPTFAGVTLPSITHSGTNGVGDIGQSGQTFATVYATTFSGVSTTAKYADLAENYSSDKHYEPGTVVVFGGTAEITSTKITHDTRVAGVISTNPAYLMNSESTGLPVAFTGRVPCKVRGPIAKGDVLVASAYPEYAERLTDSLYKPGCVLGKALGSVPDNEFATIEVVVGRF